MIKNQATSDWLSQPTIEGIVEWIETFEAWDALSPRLLQENFPSLLPDGSSDPLIAPDRAKAVAAFWFFEAFTSEEARRWLEAGLPPDEVQFALELQEAHVTPERLNEPIVHPVTQEPSTVLAVASAALHNFSSIGEALDAAGYEA